MTSSGFVAGSLEIGYEKKISDSDSRPHKQKMDDYI
jgi:hypothetical protein